MEIRLGPLRPRDRARVAELLVSTGVFSDDEVAVALQLFDVSVHEHAVRAHDAPAPDYEFTGAFEGKQLLGYACAGPTPATDGTFDLYWLAVDPAVQGKGVGRRIVAAKLRCLDLVRPSAGLAELNASRVEPDCYRMGVAGQAVVETTLDQGSDRSDVERVGKALRLAWRMRRRLR